MSSILEALRELEAGRPATTRLPALPAAEPPRRGRPLAAGVVALVLVAGVGIFFLRGTESTPTTSARPATPAPPPPPAVVAQPRAIAAPAPLLTAPTPVAAAPVAAPAAAPAAAPVQQAAAGLPPAAPATVPPAVLDAVPPRAQLADAAPTAAAEPATHAPVRPVHRESTPPVRTLSEPAEPTRRVAHAPGPPRPAGEPRVEVSGITYEAHAGERSAAIRINGADPIKLHEGDVVEGVEVQLILEDRVYVRHAGQIFAVDAR